MQSTEHDESDEIAAIKAVTDSAAVDDETGAGRTAEGARGEGEDGGKTALPNKSWNYPPGEGAMPKAYEPSRGDRRIIVTDFVYFQRRNGTAWELIGQRGVTQTEKDDMTARYIRENPDPS